MKKRLFALLALVLCVAMCAALFAGCKKTDEPDDVKPTEQAADNTENPTNPDNPDNPVETEAPDQPKTFADLYPDIQLAERQVAERIEGTDYEQPLVVGYSQFSEKFSPFFADTSYDVSVYGMTQISLSTYDRAGQIVMNGITGEYRTYNGTEYFYNGTANLDVNYDEASNTTKYTAIIRPDMTFSDGEPVTIDDVIFTYYVLLDTDYSGSTTLNSYAIQGLNEYRTQTSTEVYNQLTEMVAAMYEAGPDYTVGSGDAFTQEQYDGYWATINDCWTQDVQAIVDYVVTNYGIDDYLQAYVDPELTADEFFAEEGNKVAYGMRMWSFGKIARDENNDLVLTDAVLGNTYNLSQGEYPTIEDYVEVTKAYYENDPDAFFGAEATGGSEPDPHATADEQFILETGKEMMDGATIPSITGINRVNDWCVEVTLDGYSATAIYSVLGINITPMHYYGDPAQYDYENGQYGFPRGDLTIVRSKTATPLGAGPYKFIEYSNRVVYFEANEDYYLAQPMTKYIQFKETNSSDMISSIDAGTIDAAGDIGGNVKTFNEIMDYNSNKELQGDVLWTYQVDNNGYGYIGMNCDTVNVGGNPSSEASKNLRKGFATVLAVYRDTVIESYYGVAASVIQYPISTVSWAAPQPADEGYQIAFSKDINGNDIYTDGMNLEEKEAAALEAAKGFFEAAGFTFGEDGMVVDIPDGAKVNYEAIIPADGIGDHPNYNVLVNANNLLNKIGFGITINDPANSNVLWDALDAGTQEMWSAAWGSSIDPDMYQVYHSSNIVGLGGSDSNHYHIQSPELDELIMQARQSDDQDVRKALYKQCLDVLMDMACEIPSYQRRNCAIVSPQRVCIDSVTPDVTTNWLWDAEIYLVQMYAA